MGAGPASLRWERTWRPSGGSRPDVPQVGAGPASLGRKRARRPSGRSRPGIHSSVPWGWGPWAVVVRAGRLLSSFWKQPGWEAWPLGAAPGVHPGALTSVVPLPAGWTRGCRDTLLVCGVAAPGQTLPVWGQRPWPSSPLAPPGEGAILLLVLCVRDRVDWRVPGPLGAPWPHLVWPLPWVASLASAVGAGLAQGWRT